MAGSFCMCTCAQGRLACGCELKATACRGVALVLKAPALAGKKAKLPTIPGAREAQVRFGALPVAARALQWEAKSRAICCQRQLPALNAGRRASHRRGMDWACGRA